MNRITGLWLCLFFTACAPKSSSLSTVVVMKDSRGFVLSHSNTPGAIDVEEVSDSGLRLLQIESERDLIGNEMQMLSAQMKARVLALRQLAGNQDSSLSGTEIFSESVGDLELQKLRAAHVPLAKTYRALGDEKQKLRVGASDFKLRGSIPLATLRGKVLGSDAAIQELGSLAKVLVEGEEFDKNAHPAKKFERLFSSQGVFGQTHFLDPAKTPVLFRIVTESL